MSATPGDEPDLEQEAAELAGADAPHNPHEDGDLSDEAIEAMSEPDVLRNIRSALLKDLLKCLRDGTATHQEKAIARGLLRDNRMGIDPDDEDYKDDGPGPGGRKLRPSARRQDFPDYGGTEGG